MSFHAYHKVIKSNSGELVIAEQWQIVFCKQQKANIPIRFLGYLIQTNNILYLALV